MTALILILVASLLLFSPTAREAVADLLGVAGIEIRFDPDPAEVAGREMDLGEPVTLEEASEAVDFELSVPEDLGPPDAVFLSDRPSSGRVSMVWESDETLPASGDTGIGVVYSQFALELAEEADFVKSVRPDTSVRAVEVNDTPGTLDRRGTARHLLRGRRRQSGRGRDEAGRQRAHVGERRCHSPHRDNHGPAGDTGSGRLSAAGWMTFRRPLRFE